MYLVPVVNTKDKNVEFPDYSGFSFRIWQIIDVFAVCSGPCCILQEITPVKMNFLRYSGYSQGETLNYMRILPIFPNIRNPLQDTAEILEYSS